MKKMKVYCIGMLILGMIFVFLIVGVIMNNSSVKYDYTTSGDQIRATDVKECDYRQLTN